MVGLRTRLRLPSLGVLCGWFSRCVATRRKGWRRTAEETHGCRLISLTSQSLDRAFSLINSLFEQLCELSFLHLHSRGIPTPTRQGNTVRTKRERKGYVYKQPPTNIYTFYLRQLPHPIVGEKYSFGWLGSDHDRKNWDGPWC